MTPPPPPPRWTGWDKLSRYDWLCIVYAYHMTFSITIHYFRVFINTLHHILSRKTYFLHTPNHYFPPILSNHTITPIHPIPPIHIVTPIHSITPNHYFPPIHSITPNHYFPPIHPNHANSLFYPIPPIHTVTTIH